MGGDVNGIHPTQRSVTASLVKQGEPIDDVVELVFQVTKAVVGDYGVRWNWDREKKKIRRMSETALKKYPPRLPDSDDRENSVVHVQFGSDRNNKPATPPIEVFWHGKSYERPTRAWHRQPYTSNRTGFGLRTMGRWENVRRT
jgi:hypothetical protein